MKICTLALLREHSCSLHTGLRSRTSLGGGHGQKVDHSLFAYAVPQEEQAAFNLLGSGRVLSGTQSSGWQRSREGGLPVQTRHKRHSMGAQPYDHLRISRILMRVGCSASGSAGGSPDPSGGAAAVGETAGRPGCIPFEQG